jgi:hypothetical protein
MQPALRPDQPGTLALIDDACTRMADALLKLTELRSTIRESQDALAASQQAAATWSDT